jgi:nondiscriminating aspartyl-tRNA synthetase
MKQVNGEIGRKVVTAADLKERMEEEIVLYASIYKVRKMKGFAFVLLRTGREVFQCLFEEACCNLKLEELVEESCVKARVFVKPEERSKLGFDLMLRYVEILSVPLEGSPIVINQKRVDTSLQNLLDYRMVTLRNERERSIFKLQEGIVFGIREFLSTEHFTEIRSPKIVYQGAEGGANIFKLDYFGRDAYLAQSPQFYKQMMVGVFHRVFEIGPVFRAEKHDTSRHLNEYTSIDFEMGFIESFEDIMQMECALLRFVFKFLQENYQNELEILQVILPKVNEIPVIKFMEAKELIRDTYQREITDLLDFEPEEEKLLSEIFLKETGSEFVFVTHYPSMKRPFYTMDSPENSQETLSFDLIFRGIEITTGGQRIHQYQKQVDKMIRKDMNIEEFASYLAMHKFGMPPHGGLGLGLERFTSRLLNQDNVRYSTLFPRDLNRLTP